MAPLDDTTPGTRLDSFDVYHTSYKKIGTQGIDAAILVPKTVKPGKQPIIVRFHGGSLITGDNLYPDWFAGYFIPFIHRNNAVVVLPNYRLIPEHTGKDIIEDLNDFWTWLHHGNVSKFLADQHSTPLDLDYDHVLAVGESAGGYMALMSGLTQPRGAIKAILGQYPMTDYMSTKFDAGELFGDAPPPQLKVLEDLVANVTDKTVVSSAVPPARFELSYILTANDRYLDYFGEDKDLWPTNLMEKKDWLPPTYVIHGAADRIVLVADSQKFVEKAKKLKGVEIKLHEQPGQDHAFDVPLKEDEEPWLKEGLRWVESKWLH